MSQILSDVFFFYRKNINQLLAYILPVSLAITILSLVIANLIPTTDELEKIKILIVINFIFNPIYLAGLIFLLSSLSNQKPGERTITLSQCIGLGIFKWAPVLAVSIIYGMLTGIGLFLFIMPGLWIFLRLILAPFLVVLKDRSPIDAISESFSKTATEFWGIAGTTMLIFLSIILLQQSVISFLPDSTIVTVLVSVLGDVLWSILTLVWFRYYDLLINGV